MKLLAALVAAAAVLGGAAAQADQKHQFETPKGTVVVTVVHGPPASAAQYRSDVAEASSEESSLPPLAESSSEESSELSRLAESSSEGSFGKVGTDDLTHFVLPPEPAAARGYRPLGAAAGAAAADSLSEGSQGAPCLENCEAEEASANQAGGQVVYSQPLGDVSGSSGWAPAPGARTDAAQGVSNPSWTIVPQTGIDSSTSMPSASSIPAGSHMANLLSKVTQPLPGNAYASPEERRVQRLEVLEAAERARREQEKSQLASSMKEHQANLLKIEQMSRALRWQYTELRRQHNLLRTHIAANKATYEQLGGDDEYKGTDLDIEAKQAPNTYETLDDIAPINPRVDAAGKERITNDAVASHMKQSQVLDAMHAGQNKAINAVFGAKAEKAEKDAAAALAAAKAAESS